MLTGCLEGATGGRFGAVVSEWDVGNKLKGVGLGADGVDGVVEVGALIAASFCCGVETVGVLSSEIFNGFALLSSALATVPADANKGDVPNEKTGGADGAAA